MDSTQLQNAAKAVIAAGEGFGNKVYISDLALEMGVEQCSPAALETFKAELAALQAAGKVNLSRADLALNPFKERMSRTTRQRAEFHYFRAE